MTIKSPAVCPPIPPPEITSPKFIAHRETVLQAGKVVGRMISKTMAKRTANALNRHLPNREVV